MGKRTMLLLVLASLILFSCNDEPLTTSLKINTWAIDAESIDVYNISEDIHYKFSKENDSIVLGLENEILLDVSYGWEHNYIYVKPGEHIVLDTVGTRQGKLAAIGELSDENNYLKRFAALEGDEPRQFLTQELAKYEADTFLLKIEENLAPYLKLVKEIEADEKVNTYFKEALQLRFISIKGSDLLIYSGLYKYNNKTEAKLPDNFFDEIDTIDYLSHKLLTFEEGRILAERWLYKDVNYGDFESIDLYFGAIGDKIKENFTNSLVGDYLYFHILDNIINFGKGIDGASAMVDDFQASVTNNYLNTKLNETIGPWLKLKAGLEAPDFVAATREGEQVMLSDLKGKKIYIDVWATWCGPCIKEIPSLKTLEKELHQENIQFVSVSIDTQEDKEKWSTFIDEKELTGLQLLAKGDWNSDLATAYNIKGIPRFLLIDEEGKIISANAPRPSDPKIKETLLN